LEDEWKDAYLAGDAGRMLRSGSWYDEHKHVRGAYRLNLNPRDRIHFDTGLRVASHAPLPGQ
jgi:formylglycine-generating enzyme required for sulfatase activity